MQDGSEERGYAKIWKWLCIILTFIGPADELDEEILIDFGEQSITHVSGRV